MLHMQHRRIRTRSDGTNATKLLQGRVPEEVHRAAMDRAAAAGISLAVYLEELVRRDEVDYQTGRPLWAVDGPAPFKELSQSA
ncbi:MAG: hypothetical protein ACRC35_00925 [Angustibacter sp.]